MIERANAADVPFAWVAADSVYGVGEVEMALRRAGKGYVLGVTGSHQFWSWGSQPEVAGTAESIAEALPASAWQRLSAGSGTMIGTAGRSSVPAGARAPAPARGRADARLGLSRAR